MGSYNEPRQGDALKYQGKHFKVTKVETKPRELEIHARTAKPTGQHYRDLDEVDRIMMHVKSEDSDEVEEQSFIIQHLERTGDGLELIARSG